MADSQPPIFRRLGDGGAVFCYGDWQTRILTPAAAIIYEALADLGGGDTVQFDHAVAFLRDQLDVDLSTPAIQQTLHTLVEIGMLRE